MAANADQIAYWNDDAGPRWVAMQERMDAMLGPLMQAALTLARPVEGERVLDVGCGCGASLLALASRVGPKGQVLGVDVAEPMLARARQRVAEAGIANVAFTLADAATHAFPRASFDLVFSRFGVMFFDAPAAAFANIRTALTPSGRLAFVCWTPPRENPWFMLPVTLAKPFLPPQPPVDQEAPGPFAFANPERVRGILAEAGFGEIAIDRHEVSMRLCGPGETAQAARFAVENGPAANLLKEADPATRAAAEAAILAEYRRLEGPQGLALPGAVWLVSARSSA